MASSERLELGMRFGVALAEMNEEGLREVCTEDVTWSIPGSSRVSGTSFGVAGLLAVQRVLHDAGVTAEIQQVLYGRDSMVAMLHETGSKDGKTLDVIVASVVELRGRRIARITANVSDVEQLNRYLR
ncbi:SnoaL-like domain-containing protein [Actinoplanes sp. TBRC 11911]|uniref:nuclear transport factor 2 family protein n=1 Tax=Actinoplanes sp. TBRC 11911 TaxID=2729386 RepID=UPI00145D82CC|nr:nuclear transport factor 2 family protein [Actinoplanes sp. TBRC 11911]NMO51546.1 SnoaL-like domain-containing protein [Actinoplanes sp. TBRC 11911]